MLHMGAHALGRHAVDVDQIVIVAIHEVALHVEHVGETAGESRAEIHPRAAQNAHHAAGHVFTAMITRALEHRERPGVAHREALARGAGGVQFAARGAVQAGVAHDDRFARHEAGARRRLHHDPAARHALADVIVRFALETQMQAAGVPDAEALAHRAGERDHDRCVAHAVVAPALGDFTGDARADGAVMVLHAVGIFTAGLCRNGFLHVGEHLLGEQAPVEGRIVRIHATLRCVGNQRGIRQQRPQVELALLGGFAGKDLQQFGPSDQLRHGANAQPGHDFTAFLRHEPEVVDHHFRQADEELRTQHIVLGCDPGGAVVQMADPQVLASEGNHGCGAEAEAFGADHRGLDDVETGLQSAVGLQPHAVAQFVGPQRLMGLGQAQLPGRPGIFDRGQRARTGAAVIAADGDQVRVGLGDAGGHRAHTRLGHEFDRHQCPRIDLLQVEDQLREILDGIDVVVRRR